MRRTLALLFGTVLLLGGRAATAEPSFQVFPPSNLYPGSMADPRRPEFGLEHDAPGSLPGGRVGWYAAMDLQALEEKDWQVDPTLQAGLLVPSGDRLWRVGLGYHDGTVPIGELFQVDERYVVLGLWLSP